MMDAIDRNLDRIRSALRARDSDRRGPDHAPQASNGAGALAAAAVTGELHIPTARKAFLPAEEAEPTAPAPFILESPFAMADMGLPAPADPAPRSVADRQESGDTSLMAMDDAAAAPAVEVWAIEQRDPTSGIETGRGPEASSSRTASPSETGSAAWADNFWDRLKRRLGWRA